MLRKNADQKQNRNRLILSWFMLSLIYSFLGCSVFPEGAFITPTPNFSTATQQVHGEPNPIATNSPSILYVVQTPVAQQEGNSEYILGSWQCRQEPSFFSAVVVTLHDGENVLVLLESENKNGERWSMVQAGKKLCWVRDESFERSK